MRNYVPIAQKLQLPKGAPKLVITAENVIQAAHTSPRGSTGGPDCIVLDLLARLLPLVAGLLEERLTCEMLQSLLALSSIQIRSAAKRA